MEKLISSRRQSVAHQTPEKLKDLTPQKYGQAAYCQLTYTPSKLMDNIIYRQVSTLKKYQGDTNRLRQLEALVMTQKDKIETLQLEKQGIDHSLNHQITVYKKIIQQLQMKHQLRVKQIQTGFNNQMHRLIQDKETQAKYAQAEKQLLEQEIQRLEGVNNELKDKLNNTSGNLAQTINEKQKLQIQLDNTLEKLKMTQENMKRQTQKLKGDLQALDRKLYNTEIDWKNKLQHQINVKNKQIQNIQKLHKIQLEVCQNKRAQEAKMKNQQVKQLRQTFNNQATRLNQIIYNKQKTISCMGEEANAQKQHILEMTKKYENQINNLSHQSLRYKQQMNKLNIQAAALEKQLRSNADKYQMDRDYSSAKIIKLQQDLELTQINFTEQKTQRIRIQNILNMELDKIRLSQNKRLVYLHDENDLLQREIRNLKDLLFESSQQLEKCKQEFIKMRRQKQDLIRELRQLGLQNNSLHRLKIERERQQGILRKYERSRQKNYY